MPCAAIGMETYMRFLARTCQTSSQGLFVGQHRVVKLLRPQTHPNEVLPTAVWLSLKKGVREMERYLHSAEALVRLPITFSIYIFWKAE